ncbi:MAG: hypothetical protein HY961_21085 [Ignavibacteriae bacterium]|nr:hypothetical protein [Ignavibacteriota bacterium]
MRKLLAVGSAVAILAVVALKSGALNFLALDGNTGDDAVGAVIIHYGLFCLGIAFVTARRSQGAAVALAVGTLLAVVCLEVLLRVFTLLPERTLPKEQWLRSRKYHHVALSNEKMFAGYVSGEPIIVSTNEDGLRSQYSRSDYLRYSRRITILGDSFTFGFRVAEENSLPHKLENILRDSLRSDDVAVLNAGLTSHSPRTEIQVYEGKVRAYRPNVVVLCLDATDFGDDITYSREAATLGDSCFVTADELPHRPLPSSVLRLALPLLTYPLDLIKSHFFPDSEFTSPKTKYYQFGLDIDGVHETNRFFIYRHPLKSTLSYFESTLHNINTIAEYVRRDSSRFVLILLPRFQHWSTRECLHNWEGSMYNVEEPFQFEYLKFFDAKKDSLPYPVFNLLPAFQATDEFPLVFDTDPHLNERGNAFVAKALAHYLIEKKLVP